MFWFYLFTYLFIYLFIFQKNQSQTCHVFHTVFRIFKLKCGVKTLSYFLCIPSYDLVFFGPVFPNCLYAPNSLKLYYSAFRWSWSLSDTLLNVKYAIEGFEIIFVCTHHHDLGCLVPVSLNEPNNPNTLELAAPLPDGL